MPARLIALAAWLALLLCAGPLPAQVLVKDINEQIIRLPVTAKDRFGNVVKGEIPVTVFKPDGDGPFPLVVMSHGRITGYEGRKALGRVRFEMPGRYFLRKGFAVASPTRLGYGETADNGDPEDSSDWCPYQDTSAMFENSSAQIQQVVERLRQEPWIDRERLLLVGGSVGGLATLAATARGIPGLVASINFAGGRGGSPGSHPGKPCVPHEMNPHLWRFGRLANAPSLWIYAENDLFFAPDAARGWFDAYSLFTTERNKAELVMLPPHGDDGHDLMGTHNDVWQPMLDEYLARFGFTRSGVMQPPPPTAYARLGDFDPLYRLTNEEGRDAYRLFLQAVGPRAFAIGPRDTWSYAVGDDAMTRAIFACQRRTGEPCRLYAVNDAVVWREAPFTQVAGSAAAAP